MAATQEPRQDRGQDPQEQLASHLHRSAWALLAGGVLLVLSGTFVQSGGPSLTLMTVIGMAMLALAVVVHFYARKLSG